MASISIAPYFPFARINVVNQRFSDETSSATIVTKPDRRFHPICHKCQTKASAIHSHHDRQVRDLDFGGVPVWVECHYRKIVCPSCGKILVEDLGLFHPYLRVTNRMAQYVHGLCRVMTVNDVAQHLGLDWKTVKQIDKQFLEADFGQPDYDGLRILAVDEIAVRKGHNYLTVVIDYETGRVLYMGKGRKTRTLKRFFNQLKPRQRKAIEAVSMDMWAPFIKAVRHKLPNAKIVFDLFHVMSAFGRVIDKVRIHEYRHASEADKAVFKGAKYLLLKNRKNIRSKSQRKQLEQLLALNETINKVMILKDKLRHIWTYRSRTWAAKALDSWCSLARSIKNRSLTAFTKTLQRYRYGILNHCDYRIHNSKIEGINNKIKVIKRKAYGFHDLRYLASFILPQK